MLAVWLREKSPQELGRAGLYKSGLEAGTNQLPGQPTVKHTCNQSNTHRHTHTQVIEGNLIRGN